MHTPIGIVVLRITVIVSLVLLPTIATAATAKTKAKILVMSSKPEQGISQGSATLLDEIMTAELSKDPRFDVITQGEISKMVQLETMKQSAGCKDDSCLAEIGGALGAEYLVTSSLGQLGTSFVVSVKMLNLRTTSVSRWTETVPAQEDMLAVAVRNAVHEVLPVEAFEQHRWSYVAAGIGGAAVIAGATLGGLDMYAVGQRNEALINDKSDKSWDNSAHTFTTGANVAWSVAAGAVVAGIILWIVERKH